LYEIDSVTGADVHPQFTDATAEGFGVTKVSQAASFQPGKDAGFCLGITQAGQPLGKDGGLPHLVHFRSVSVRIRIVKATGLILLRNACDSGGCRPARLLPKQKA
jgi:hypothetical protein